MKKNLYKFTIKYTDNTPPETKLFLATDIADVQSETQSDRYFGEWLLVSETAEKVVYQNRSSWADFNRVLMTIEKTKFTDLTE